MDDYERAGHALGLSKQILDSISQSKQSDVEIKNAILFAWKRKNGSAATSVELLKTFLVIEERYVTEAILKYLSKKITSLPEIHPMIPNWDDLTYSEREAVRNILIDENRSVREAYAIFVTQLMESFMERNVKPGVIWSLIYSYGGFKHSKQYHSDTFFMHSQQYRSDTHFMHSQQHPSDDSITAVFSELSKLCTWFDYELFQVILKVKGNETEEKFLKIYVDQHFIPYLKHSIFKGKDVRRRSSHEPQPASTCLKLFVSEDLYTAGNESKAIKPKITQLLSFKDDSVWYFEVYIESRTIVRYHPSGGVSIASD